MTKAGAVNELLHRRSGKTQTSMHITGLPWSGKKFWKMKIFQVREKSGSYIFSQGNLKKNEKSHGKVREFQNFPKKTLVDRLLEILVSIICKQY